MPLWVITGQERFNGNCLAGCIASLRIALHRITSQHHVAIAALELQTTIDSNDITWSIRISNRLIIP